MQFGYAFQGMRRKNLEKKTKLIILASAFVGVQITTGYALNVPGDRDAQGVPSIL